MKKQQPKTRTKELQDELERVENKLRAEMAWFRNEIKPLKDRQREILDEIDKYS
jgi:DNA helicase IV